MNDTKLAHFMLDGRALPVRFIEAYAVKDGVDCDVYDFIDDASRDLGIVTVRKGVSTPRQKIVKGDITIEGYLSGAGILSVTDTKGKAESYDFPCSSRSDIRVKLGEIMSWRALEDLTFYEICEPRYEDGRFQVLD